MKKIKLTYILLILLGIASACKQARLVPEGKYLLKKNNVIQTGEKLDKYDLEAIVRQQPNYKRFGVKWKLAAYNVVDSSKVADKRIRINQKLTAKNNKKIAKQIRINKSRKEKAIAKGRTHYTEKLIPLKDTVKPKMFFREWYKYKIGHPPVVFDSISYEKTLEQFDAYLKKKGYYYGEVTGHVAYKSNRKSVVTYHVETGSPYIIDSISLTIPNDAVRAEYFNYVRKNGIPFIGDRFDSDELDDYRYVVARYLRNSGFYGFSSNNISYVADTSKSDRKVMIDLVFGDRIIKSVENKDSIITIPHQKTYINKVHFHLADSVNFEGNFSSRLRDLGLPLHTGQFLTTIDTSYYTSVKKRRTDSLDNSRIAIFMYNGKLAVKEKVLEAQNYLEMDKLYTEKKLEKTYLSLLQLDLFSAVKTVLVEEDEAGCVDAHYYLIPKKKQHFAFDPRATNSNGFLGVAATLNYINRNTFRGGEKLTMSVSGGFESQPPIFDETIDGSEIQTAARSFNTFEVGPSTSLELPGLFPIRSTRFSKRLRPKTIISAAYNYQHRDDFIRGTFQANYLWRFYSKKTMIFQTGLPGASVVKFVNIDKSDSFDDKLEQLNDLFLLNSYSNQFIWQDWKLTFEYNIKEKESRHSNSQLYFLSSFDPAGNIFSLFKKFQDTMPNGQYAIMGIGYAQFSRIDNELIYSKPLAKDKSINFRLELGAGIPYGNTTTSLPYDYSFFAGGANDNRGWRARGLGPGSYRYYLDTNRTATQIGDMRLGASAEFRFAFNSFFKGAFFVDAGNVWTTYEDENRIGGQISGNWYKEIAIGGGFGVRMDLEYFIIRVDLGVPLYDPALPLGSQWIFDKRDAYYQAGKDAFGDDFEKYLPIPFIPKLHFGIGYPF